MTNFLRLGASFCLVLAGAAAACEPAEITGPMGAAGKAGPAGPAGNPGSMIPPQLVLAYPSAVSMVNPGSIQIVGLGDGLDLSDPLHKVWRFPGCDVASVNYAGRNLSAGVLLPQFGPSAAVGDVCGIALKTGSMDLALPLAFIIQP